MSKRIGWALAGVILVSAACSSGDAGTGDDAQNITAGGACAVKDAQTGGTLDPSKDDTPFARIVLASAKKCPTTVTDLMATLKTSAGAPPNVFAVNELGDQTNGKTRFVVSQQTVAGSTTTGPADFLWSTLEDAPGTISEGFIEVISFSPSRAANVFYKLINGAWTVMGDGTQIVPGGAAKVECQACHTSGALNFKELKLPWNNWNSQFDSLKSAPAKGAFATLFKARGDAPILQGIVQNGNVAATKARVDAALQGKRGQSLKSLLRSVMCDVGEPALVSSVSPTAKRTTGEATADKTFEVPNTFFLDDLLGEQASARIAGVEVPISGYADAIKANGQTLDGVPQGDTKFQFFAPERSFVDIQVARELLQRNLLTKDMLVDLLMTDFTNPVFSKDRCALADTAPDSGKTSEEIRTAWIKNLGASTLPAAKDLAARLSDTGDLEKHGAAINAFADACLQRAANDGAALARDLVKLQSQRRVEFDRAFHKINESPALLPKDKLGSQPGALHLKPDCTVGQ
jgi:hypothetical protein